MPPYQPGSYWHNLLAEKFDLRGVGWPSLSRGFNRWQYAARESAVARLIVPKSDWSVLDVGSGTGYWVAYWLRSGVRSVHGMDLTAVSVVELRRRFPGQAFEQGDVSQGIPFRHEFDLVSAIDVLLHITADDLYVRALGNLRAATKAGGKLAIIEPLAQGAPMPFVDGASSKARSLGWFTEAARSQGWALRAVFPVTWLMSNPVDLHPAWLSRASTLSWKTISRIARRDPFGWLAGAATYPIDRVITRVLRGSPAPKAVLLEAL